MAKSRIYYTVAVIWEKGGAWEIHFGDYDKNVAEQEATDIKESGEGAYKAKVITTGDTAAQVKAGVAKLNETK